MGVEHLIAFNLALFAAIASPGPALLVATQTTLSAGRRAGFAVGCGLGLVAAMWTGLALIGLETVFELVPWAYAVVKTAGALYLLYIAWMMWRGARDPLPETVQPARRAFRRGLLINLLNPKSVLFAAAVLVVVFPPNMTLAESAVVVLNHLLVELLFYAALSWGLSTETMRRRYLRAKRYLDRVASVMLGGLGVRLLTERASVGAP